MHSEPAHGGPISDISYLPNGHKIVVIHSDDLGMCHSVNRATFEALEHGTITSASLMVPCPWFLEAARLAREKTVDIGVHLTFTSEWNNYRWAPIAGREVVPTLVDSEGYFWKSSFDLARAASPQDVEREARAQIATALRFGVKLTHIDTHMFSLWQNASLFEVFMKVGREYGLPCLVLRSAMRRPDFAGKIQPGDLLIDQLLSAQSNVSVANWEDAYIRAAESIREGITIINVHLGYNDEELRSIAGIDSSWGAAWRERDRTVIMSPRFIRALHASGAELHGWATLASIAVAK